MALNPRRERCNGPLNPPEALSRILLSPLLGLALGGLGLIGGWIWLTSPAVVRLSCQVRAAFILDCRQQSDNSLGIPLQQNLVRQTASLRIVPEDPSSAPIYRLILLGGSQSLALNAFPVAYEEAVQAQRAIADWQDQPLGFRRQIQLQAPPLLRIGIPLGSIALMGAGAFCFLRNNRVLADGS